MTRFQDIRHLAPLIGAVFPKINEGGHFEVLHHIASGSHGAVPSGSSGRCIERQDWLCCQNLGGARKQPLKLKSAGSDCSAPHARVSDCKDDYYYTAPYRYSPHCWVFRRKGLDPVARSPSCHRTKMPLEPIKEYIPSLLLIVQDSWCFDASFNVLFDYEDKSVDTYKFYLFY